jgi:malate dehydrogenase (oxaloacetate-decarboxylating)
MTSLSHSAQFSIILRLELQRRPGSLGRLTSAIGEAGGQIGAVDILVQGDDRTLREITVDCSDREHWDEVVRVVESLDEVNLIEVTDRTFELHRGG